MRPELTKISEALWEIPVSYKQGMRVPARIVATETLLAAMDDGVFEQITNVAQLPGIVEAAYCMPDGHRGYGFPIGGVAAMDPNEGVISPGGIGFDINCGMRLVMTNLTVNDIKPHLERLIDRLFVKIPAGVGGHGKIKLSRSEFSKLAQQGAAWCINQGYGWAEDLERTEENGCFSGADAKTVSDKAMERGISQLGTLGSGNHYLEIQAVYPHNVFNKELASDFGITLDNQIAVMFHCGSRGFGHQIASDYVQSFLRVMEPKYKISVSDRQLACAPFESPEGQAYFSAMKCGVNMAFANRQIILHNIREVFSQVFGRSAHDLGMRQVYDVSHNTAKLEDHEVRGVKRRLLVHRKGATRSFAPGMPGIPQVYAHAGQPVIIGGSMETGSYLLAGSAGGQNSFFSTAHGSGRVMGRKQAGKGVSGKELLKEMRERGIYVKTASLSGLSEEGANAYKDIDEVVKAADLAGLSRPVARFTPLGNVKG
ncbi:MAG: RtcB family protein [Chitinispirillales bacterium]|jgi:tRNA-splicing ligase RtcB|nr:RtcB family protein [Chitinispirillales bacterium]